MTNELLKGKSLQKAILQDIESLPPMPAIVESARRIMDDPDSSFKDLANLIEKDQSLAMKVLRLSNSAYYGRLQKASSIQDAAVVLGLKALGELLTVACLAKRLDQTLNGYNLSAGVMWRHSLSVAVGSRIVATRKYPNLMNEAFSAGLIHDAGKLILDKYILERKAAFHAFVEAQDQTFLAAEKAMLGFDHAEIAARVCGAWSFPKQITAAVKYHHRPSRFRGGALAFIVCTADQIAIWGGMQTDGISLESEIKSFDNLDIPVEEIGPIIDEVSETVNDITKQLAV